LDAQYNVFREHFPDSEKALQQRQHLQQYESNAFFHFLSVEPDASIFLSKRFTAVDDHDLFGNSVNNLFDP